MPPPRWVIDAAQLPVAFAQVREDPLIDLAVLQNIGRPDIAGIMIASGGCTAAFLAASGLLSHLHLVDFNPAQMELCQFKLKLLQDADPAGRLQALGHGNSSGTTGDSAGRYEVLFSHLREALSDSIEELTAILLMDRATRRAAHIAPATPLGRRFDAAFDTVMSLQNLVHLFGEKATQNRLEPFSRHFATRTRHAIAKLSTADNPYLWQMLLGRFPDGVYYPWFTVPTPARMPEISNTIGMIDSALAGRAGQFDFVHLSNVLDWLSPAEVATTLGLAFDALCPGGHVIIRQLNSSLDIPASGHRFEWLTDEANRLHAIDRSFFYRSLHLGRKR